MKPNALSEDMADAAVAIVQTKDGRVVFVRRQFDPFKAYWSLPGGISDPGESPRETAVREVEEETGLRITITRVIGVYPDPWRTPSGYCACYLADIAGGRIIEEPPLEVMEIGLMDQPPKVSEIAFDQAKWLDDAGLNVPGLHAKQGGRA